MQHHEFVTSAAPWRASGSLARALKSSANKSASKRHAGSAVYIFRHRHQMTAVVNMLCHMCMATVAVGHGNTIF